MTPLRMGSKQFSNEMFFGPQHVRQTKKNIKTNFEANEAVSPLHLTGNKAVEFPAA